MTPDAIVSLAKVRSLAASGTAKKIRVNSRLSLSEVAGACGVSEATVWQWENSGRRPRGDAALRYAELLEALSEAA